MGRGTSLTIVAAIISLATTTIIYSATIIRTQIQAEGIFSNMTIPAITILITTTETSSTTLLHLTATKITIPSSHNSRSFPFKSTLSPSHPPTKNTKDFIHKFWESSKEIIT
jgi:hypothetical protein